MTSRLTSVQVALEVEGGEGQLTVTSLSGREAAGELFRFELSVTSDREGFDFAERTGKAARVTLSDGSYERAIDGVVSRFEQPEHTPDGAFVVEIVPREWLKEGAEPRGPALDRPAETAPIDGGGELSFAPEGGEGVASFGVSCRLQRGGAPRLACAGRARSLRLAPGRSFTLRGHPRRDYEAPYVITSVEHDLSGGAYTAAFTCEPLAERRAQAAPAAPAKIVLRDAGAEPDGCNQLSFDSAEGCEQVHLRARRDLRIEVLNNSERTIGQDEALSVARDYSIAVDGNSLLSVGGDDIVEVGGSQSIQVVGGRTIAVDGDHCLQIAGTDKLEVVGEVTRIFEGSCHVTVQGAERRSNKGDVTLTLGASRSCAVAGNETLRVGGHRIETVAGNRQLAVEGAATELYGSLMTSVSADVALCAEGEVRIESSSIQKLGAPSIYLSASSKLYLRARDQIVLEVGGTRLTIEDGKVTLTSGSTTKVL